MRRTLLAAALSATLVATGFVAAAPAQCAGLGRGPLGLVDWGQLCTALTDPGKAFATALGIPLN